MSTSSTSAAAHGDAAATAHDARLSALASSFIRQYYHLLATAPDGLAKLYGDDSSWSHGSGSDDTVVVKGKDAIRAALSALDVTEVNIGDGSMDVQEIGSDASLVLLVVTGFISHAHTADSVRTFSQSFVLAHIPTANAYYLRNDCMRIQQAQPVGLGAAIGTLVHSASSHQSITEDIPGNVTVAKAVQTVYDLHAGHPPATIETLDTPTATPAPAPHVSTMDAAASAHGGAGVQPPTPPSEVVGGEALFPPAGATEAPEATAPAPVPAPTPAPAPAPAVSAPAHGSPASKTAAAPNTEAFFAAFAAVASSLGAPAGDRGAVSPPAPSVPSPTRGRGRGGARGGRGGFVSHAGAAAASAAASPAPAPAPQAAPAPPKPKTWASIAGTAPAPNAAPAPQVAAAAPAPAPAPAPASATSASASAAPAAPVSAAAAPAAPAASAGEDGAPAHAHGGGGGYGGRGGGRGGHRGAHRGTGRPYVARGGAAVATNA